MLAAVDSYKRVFVPSALTKLILARLDLLLLASIVFMMVTKVGE